MEPCRVRPRVVFSHVCSAWEWVRGADPPEPRLVFETQTDLAWELMRKASLL